MLEMFSQKSKGVQMQT